MLFLSTGICWILVFISFCKFTICVFYVWWDIGYTARAREWDVEEANETDKESEGE